jgi:lauroyl/myristoyl acyltransferase
VSRRTRLRDTVVYLRYLALWQTIAYLPGPAARRLPQLLGYLWWRFGSDTQRQQVTRNMARIVKDDDPDTLATAVRAAYIYYVRYWVDSFRLHRISARRLVEQVNDHGIHHLRDVTRTQEGAVFITGHLGSWDLGAAFCSALHLKLFAVAEEVKPARLFARFVRLRADAGIEVLALRRGVDLIGPLRHAMATNGALATLLADRDLTRRGPIVSFFGEPCRLPAGAAALALRTGRPIVAGAFFVNGNRYDGVVLPPFHPATTELYDVTQQVAHTLEELVRYAPEQWHVFVPNWLADREPHHPVVAAWQAGEDWQTLAKADYATRRRPPA